MKMNKEQLKALIKECIVEVLSEGLGSRLVEHAGRPTGQVLQSGQVSTGLRRPPPSQAQRLAFDPKLDTPVNRGMGQSANTRVLEAAIKASSHGNSTMAAIFADTAATTMVEQSKYREPTSAGSSQASHGISSVEQINGNPDEIFGEDAAARWADLAFMDAPAKKTA